MEQLTKDEAIELGKSLWWKDKSPREIVSFQLYQEKLCMDFSDFHKALEEVLGRPVWTHEFALGTIKDEFEGKCGKPSMEAILNLLPKDKTILAVIK